MRPSDHQRRFRARLGASKFPHTDSGRPEDFSPTVLTFRNPNRRIWGLPGAQRSQKRGPRATSPEGPRPIFPAAVGEPRAPPSAGCGPRRARGLGRSAAPRHRFPGSAQPLGSRPGSRPGPQRLGRGFLPPFHFAPVQGNLRFVTRILKRATCSAGRAAPSGISGLGRRGLGTPGSGGHAGVGAPWRPAPAAR